MPSVMKLNLDCESGVVAQNPGAELEKLLTKTDVARICQVTPRCVDNWQRKGLLVFYKFGRTVRFRLGDLQAHWDAHFRIGGRKPRN
jgi:hypothetical protein